MRIFLLTLFVCLSVASGKATAEELVLGDIGTGEIVLDEIIDEPNWGECRIPPLPPIIYPADDLPEDELAIFSGQARFTLSGNASFDEDISLVRGDRLLTAQSANYDRQTGVFSVEGQVEFRDPLTRVYAESAQLNQFTEELRFDSAEFQLWSVPARGESEFIEAERNGKLRLSKASYTSCPEGNNAWMLKASKISIDQESGVGTAKHARLEFKGVPVLYLPYISYPVTNERKTGLLIPKIGASQQRGIDIEVPYYWNIAPQFDATFIPRYMSKRGIQVNSEFRYLTKRNEGSLIGEILPHDDVTDDHRSLVAVQHTTNITNDWRAQIDATQVSDSTYFEDLSSSLASTSQINLLQRADIDFYNDIWSGLLRFENYQSLDDTIPDNELPYTTLPKLAVRGYTPDGWLGLKYTLDSELAYFYRDIGVTGLREHIQTEIALPKRLRVIDIEPAIALFFTGYQLDDTAPGASSTPSVAAPVFSVDTHTVFEKLMPKRGWMQTLEPRMLYTYIPERDQSDLPVFDTIMPDLNIVQLYRKNRFVGYDRIGDTNHLSLGITTRLIDAANGDEFMNATFGQILYFNDRGVTLPDGMPGESSTSDYLFEFGMKLHENWRMQLGYQFNTDTSQSQRTEIRLNYRANDFKLANISYRFRRDFYEEIDISAAWPVVKHWNLVGRYDYSILDSKVLERFAGIEYDTCCWSIRGIWRRSLTNRSGESDTSFSIQLQLKGLGNNTSAAEHWLDRDILDRY